MQPLLEAATHIAQEIERTRQHLANLEQALEGLRPLITLDAATTTLPYTASIRAQSIEDVSIVLAQVSAPDIVKSKRAARAKPAKRAKGVKRAKPATAPSTGAALWLRCMGRKKLKLDELVDAALKKLELDDTSRALIKNRAGAWLHAANKNGVVKSTATRDGQKLYQRVTSQVS